MNQWDTEPSATPATQHNMPDNDSAFLQPQRYNANSTEDILTDSIPVGDLDFKFEDHYAGDAQTQPQTADWNMPMGVPFLFPSW